MAKYGKSLPTMHEHEWTYHELFLKSLKPPPPVKIWPSKKSSITYKGPQKKESDHHNNHESWWCFSFSPNYWNRRHKTDNSLINPCSWMLISGGGSCEENKLWPYAESHNFSQTHFLKKVHDPIIYQIVVSGWEFKRIFWRFMSFEPAVDFSLRLAKLFWRISLGFNDVKFWHQPGRSLACDDTFHKVGCLNASVLQPIHGSPKKQP